MLSSKDRVAHSLAREVRLDRIVDGISRIETVLQPPSSPHEKMGRSRRRTTTRPVRTMKLETGFNPGLEIPSGFADKWLNRRSTGGRGCFA